MVYRSSVEELGESSSEIVNFNHTNQNKHVLSLYRLCNHLTGVTLAAHMRERVTYSLCQSVCRFLILEKAPFQG